MIFYRIFVLICHPSASFSCLLSLPHFYCNRLTQKESKAKQEAVEKGQKSKWKIDVLVWTLQQLRYFRPYITQQIPYIRRAKKDHKLNLLCVWIDLWLFMMRKFTFNRIHTHIYVYVYTSKVISSKQSSEPINQPTNQPTKKWKKRQINYKLLYAHTCIVYTMYANAALMNVGLHENSFLKHIVNGASIPS